MPGKQFWTYLVFFKVSLWWSFLIFFIDKIVACVKHFFFLSGFSFANIHRLQDRRGRGRTTPHYHFHPLHGHLDISRAITAESSPLRIANSRTQTGNLWFPGILSRLFWCSIQVLIIAIGLIRYLFPIKIRYEYV